MGEMILLADVDRMRSTLSAIVAMLVVGALGAATTVGVALAAARWSNVTAPVKGLVGRQDGPFFDAAVAVGPGIERWNLTWPVRLSRPLWAPSRLEAPAWLPLPDGSNDLTMSRIEVVAAGWPMICLRTESTFDLLSLSLTARVWRNGYVVDRGSAVQPFTTTVLPLGPVWKGLILNTLIFSAGWSACFAAAWLTRTIIRRCRGRCTRCGYDLRGGGGDRCPECGGRIRSQQRRHHRIRQQEPAPREPHPVP